MFFATPPRFRLVLVALLSCCLSSTAFAQLRAGAAKVDITPSMGVSLDGPISKNGPATSVHDPLYARALVLDDGATQIAMVVCDACMIEQQIFDAAKRKVHDQIGLPESRMLMAATHTHAAVRAIHIGREAIDDEYHRLLAENIARSVIQAHKNLAPARIGYASFDRPDLLACRRFLCEPGSVDVNPFGESGERIKSVAGRSNAVIEPAGPIDPQFSILAVRHADGSPLCMLGNFSVHYCGGYSRGAVSADYFGYFCNAVATRLGGVENHPPVVGIMSNGTSGNTGAFQRTTTEKFKPFEGMQFYGRTLAEEAINAAGKIEYRGDVTIEMGESELPLTVRRPDAKRLEWADDVLKNPDAKLPHRWSKIYAQEAKLLADNPMETRIKLQAIRIGEVGIAAAPSEVFAETGLAIKAQSSVKHIFTIELANGYGGYLPTREQHRLGGYETWPARSSFLEVDAESKIRNRLIDLLISVSTDK